MEIVILILLAAIALDFAALRWGTDTRDGFGAVRPRPPF
jgi:hypothetical protein